MLNPDTRALWENISQLVESDVKDELRQQLCGFIQHRLVLAQTAAAQPPSLPTPSDVRVKGGGGMGPGEEDHSGKAVSGAASAFVFC